MVSPISSPPAHLNNAGCTIKCTEGKGRGVYGARYWSWFSDLLDSKSPTASRPIPRQTVIEISPVLLFSKEEYKLHGKHTILDQYTFKWSEGRMALALGLGSLFNHSTIPNVSYQLDPQTDSIRYVTARDVGPDEELCIFYGHNLWFDPVDPTINVSQEETEDGWGGLMNVDETQDLLATEDDQTIDENPDEVVPEEKLPFIRFKPPPEEENIDTIRTMQAWVVDIPEPRSITKMLKWLKQTGLDAPESGHLKRIRKQGELATLLLTTSHTSPKLPEDLHLPDPYTLLVPVSSALTPTSLKLKSTFWPTTYTPSRKGEAEEWTRGKVRWANEAVQRLKTAVNEAKLHGELPIVAHIPIPYEMKDQDPTSLAFTARDSRISNNHPLRHAVINVVRKMADYRASIDSPSQSHNGDLTNVTVITDGEELRNGSNYLLTSLTLFTTHEPCIMCSMALTHSRVKEIIYLYPMAKTGGCGGVACLPTLKGVNHRFEICQWVSADNYFEENLGIDSTIDA